MMPRKQIVNIHLALSSLIIPWLLLVCISGSLKLFDIKGELVKTEAFAVQNTLATEASVEQKEVYFRQMFKDQGLRFDFEYIRETPAEWVFRPSSRLHYSAKFEGDFIKVLKLEPNLLYQLMEIHKGHGPQLMKTLGGIFGVSLLLVIASGVWLAFMVPLYRKLMITSLTVGTIGFLIICYF